MEVRRARHDVFRATLRIDELVHIACDWTFRVYADHSLSVEIQRPADWRERATPARGDLERLERELGYSYVVYDGTALPLPANGIEASLSASATRPSAYTCTFFLTKYGAEGERWTATFTGRLLPDQGFVGQWEHDSEVDYELPVDQFEDAGPLDIPPSSAWSATVEPVETLAPLTVGSYTLAGSFMEDEYNGFVVPISMAFSLHADGSLTGTCTAWLSSRGDGEPNTDVLSGSWTRYSIQLAQHFSSASTKVFAYRGHVDLYAVTGIWSVVELEALDGWEDSVRQRFQLRVTKMVRPWTPKEHALFPDSFRKAVRLLLLSSVQANESNRRVPSAVWPRVLAYCDSEWFRDSE